MTYYWDGLIYHRVLSPCMNRTIPNAGDTFLTQRQIEVLSLRERGVTQKSIASQLGTSVANISTIETSARVNIAKAEQTITLAKLLKCNIIFNVQEGTELWDLVSRIYTMADNDGTKLAYTEPELVAFINRGLKHVFDDRKLISDAEIGLTPDGNLIINPTL